MLNRRYKITRGTTLSGGVKYTTVGECCNYHHLSLKRYQIGPIYNYCGTLKESHNLADRFVSVRMTLSHLERRDAKGQTFPDDLRN